MMKNKDLIAKNVQRADQSTCWNFSEWILIGIILFSLENNRNLGNNWTISTGIYSEKIQYVQISE